jgi:2-dehydro-3-deoxy-L-rhamnonate dehydrogenase (NAD+)
MSLLASIFCQAARAVAVAIAALLALLPAHAAATTSTTPACFGVALARLLIAPTPQLWTEQPPSHIVSITLRWPASAPQQRHQPPDHGSGPHMPSTYDLKGRIAVVTGGAQGIGRATTERFLASGAKVAIWDFDLKLATQTATALGKDVLAVACDVTDPKSVQAARDATVKAFGKIDILVNNAGIAGPTAKLWDYSLADLKQTMAVNLEGPFNCCQAVIPGMIKNNYGRIVNIASIAGKEGNPNASAYSASKAALIGLTKSLGKELAGYDISVNAVTPAAARTAIFDQITQEHIDFMLSKIPRARFVTVEEVASLITFAASSDCSFTTGQVLDISGGRATY